MFFAPICGKDQTARALLTNFGITSLAINICGINCADAFKPSTMSIVRKDSGQYSGLFKGR